ncbi:glutamate/gamma-aminobutyrate family transporter YjeM [Clostridium baratii]|uniref:glutamate/gamma-aminobutyrate family transporter YjeM n=1 Tax=Clostridium baratii TaxID=1561 RepID=UPI001C023B98|nr:glutamate/gamma-aminobutyrate family transporter YjeM [Clostridium baratii]MBT9830650.1 glutamate/gamma-aminobutyrate family transporter YjeM [Clostridium baratii]MDY3206391.1 glutamate/gamma-aminobutyrate family transporter YjeM [Clostridium baratii]
MSENNNQKLTLISLILMIFTSVFGFTNIARAYYLMGYSAIPWYILSAVTFFIPYAFMMAEYGAAFRKEKGGIYSWMDKSVGPKYAFIVTFMWYASNIIWMVSVSSSIWVPLSNLVFGADKTSTLSIFGMSAPHTMALLAVILLLVITFTASKGLNKITKFTSIGGAFSAFANVILFILSIVILALNHFKLATPVSAEAFTKSPNPGYQSPLGILGFLVFAIFAYGGIEVIGGLVDQTKNAEKTFPKGIKISAIVIATAYSVEILCVGFFTNWNITLNDKTVNMANVAYVVMGNLGYSLGQALHLDPSICHILYSIFARFIGLSMFLALMGAFVTIVYSPLKQLIEGTPKEIWPKVWIKLDKNNMPKNAMIIQCLLVIAIVLITSFGGESVSKFLNYLILMGNVAMTIPYIFIALAFIPFKKNKNIEKPFVIYKSNKSTLIWTIIIVITVTFANIFTIIQPIIDSGDYVATIFQIAGPIVFGGIALILYNRYEKKKNTIIIEEVEEIEKIE